MVIYVDTLMFTNIVVDYILLSVTALLLKRNYSTFRIAIASLIGGFSSLYIFVENKYMVLDIAVKFAIGIILVIIVLGKSSFKIFVFSYLLFLTLSFGLNGMVVFLENLSKDTFISKNFVSYINVSPVLLIIFTALFYLIVRLFQRFFDKDITIDYAELSVKLLEKQFHFRALIDSGHTLQDPLSDSQVIIVDLSKYQLLINNSTNDELSTRKRVIPIKTVGNIGLLEGIRCDKAVITANTSTYSFNNPVILCSAQPLGGMYSAVISKSALNRLPDNT